MIKLVLFALAITAFVQGLDHTNSRHVIYYRDGFPKEWIMNARAPSTVKKEFYIALYQQNVHLLEGLLYSVAHPKSPSYGKHLTYDQIMETIAPPKENVETVTNWLIKGGVSPSEIRSRGDALIVKTSVANIENLFQTEMYTFEHSVKSRKIIAHMGESSVPLEIKSLVEMVTGLSFFPPPKKLGEEEKPEVPGPQTAPWLIPSQLRMIYNIPMNLRATNPKTSQAAVEFEWPGCFNYTDMEVYQEVVQFPFTNVSRIIPENEWVDSGCDGESALDLQMMLTMEVELKLHISPMSIGFMNLL